MAEKCEAVLGGNRCGFYAIYMVSEAGIDDDGGVEFSTGHLSCTKHVGVVMEENDIDHAEVEKI